MKTCPHCAMEGLQDSAVVCPHCWKELATSVFKGVYKMKGMDSELEVFEDKLTLTPKGWRGVLNKGLAGTKTIPFSSIVAVQYRKAGRFTEGFLQFTILGGIEVQDGIEAAQGDENSFLYLYKDNAVVVPIKEYIERQVQALKASPPPPPSSGGWNR